MANQLRSTDPRQARPTELEITAFWGSVRIEWRASDEVVSNARWVEEMRRLYRNGGVAATRFELVGETAVFDWFAQRNRLDEEIQICTHLVARIEILRALFGSESEVPRPDAGAFRADAGFLLDGELAAHLALGGAHLPFGGSDAEAQVIARQLADALTEGRASEVTVFRAQAAWHPWFKNTSAFDRTWVVIDRRRRVVTMVATTDES
jgi:hypothetical protein